MSVFFYLDRIKQRFLNCPRFIIGVDFVAQMSHAVIHHYTGSLGKMEIRQLIQLSDGFVQK